MRVSKSTILSFLFISFFISLQFVGVAQMSSAFSIDSIANIEQKAFVSYQSANERDGISGLTRVASSNDFDINYYRCEWTIDPAVRFISGKVTSYFTITSTTNTIIFDLSDTLNVDSITYHGLPVSYQRPGNDALKIVFPNTIAAGQKDSVAVFYNGVPRIKTSFPPFVQNMHSGTPIIWTLSEPFGAKEWWPCKNGLSDKADSIDILITNPSSYQASSNGLMMQETIVGSSKTSLWKHRFPIASYLVAFSVTNYSVLKDTILIGGKSMDLIDYVYPEYTSLFNSQRFVGKAALRLFGNLFGDYPFAKEKYGFTQFGAGGGMEHQTNSFINYPGVELLEHETAHQWFGDKITCGSWQDIWLNEGFATYCQVLYNQFVDTMYYYPILKNFTRDITNAANGSVWVDDTTDANRVFNGKLSYDKGCFILHMLRWKMGDDIFFRGMRRYLNDTLLKYSFARTTDFIRNMQQESGMDLTSFFQKWFYGKGYPNYNCTWMQNKNNWIKVQINQTTSDPSVSFYDMPVQLKFMSAEKDTLITLNNLQNGQIFWVNPGFKTDSMAVDPNYWILAKDRLVTKLPAQSTNENEIKIYPNPATDKLNISILNPSSTRFNIKMYNFLGQLVYESNKTLSGRDELFSIPILNLSKGIYTLRFSDGNSANSKSIIVR